MAKLRLDQLLVERGLVETRSKAQALIMAGKVLHGTARVTKPGQNVPQDAAITVEEKEHPWVSRGGMKLSHAIKHGGIEPEGRICLDVGASTGGFTDVLLHHGAAKVYAVDVGHGQLDWKIRSDPRVVVLEKTNARYLTVAEIPDPISLIVCDASFIGLSTVLPAALALGTADAELVALIKPQFEAGKEEADKGEGVIRDPAIHQAVCADVVQWLEAEMHWRVSSVTESPITGPKGNKEFLVHAFRGAA